MKYTKQKWKKLILEKIAIQYGDLSPVNLQLLDTLLEEQWLLSSERFVLIVAQMIGYSFSHHSMLPTVLVSSKFLEAVGMGAAYMAGTFLSAGLCTDPRLMSHLPDMEAIETKHLDALFKKADDFNQLANLLKVINNDFYIALAGQRQALLVGSIGFFAGGLIAGPLLGSSSWLGGIVGSRILPKLTIPNYEMITTKSIAILKSGVKNQFEKNLEAEHPGLRRRNTTPQ